MSSKRQTVSGLGVHWWQVPNKLEDGVLTTCQAGRPCDFPPFILNREILPIPHLVLLTGVHGDLYSGGPLCLALHEINTTLLSQVLVSTASV